MRFKHLYIILPLLWAAKEGRAQANAPNMTETAPLGTLTAGTLPAEVNTAGDVNYIRSFVPMVPVTDMAAVNSSNAASGNIREQTVYLDGFMQPFQSVTRNVANVGGQPKHLVNIAYNYPTQEQLGFLPYTSGSEGLQPNAFQAQRDYYTSLNANLYPGEGYTCFSKTKVTSDAGQYSTTSYLPGKSQVGMNRGTVTQSLANAANEVIIWQMDGNMPVASGYYAARQLFGQQTVLPSASAVTANAPQSKAFKDKDGKLILKMAAANNDKNNNITYEYTYYVYDEKGNLRCVITPKAFRYYQANNTLATGNVLKNLCFQYQYDAKGRLAAAQKPGEESATYVVYDAKDRPVMRQTPNERTEHKWEISFYDAQGRIKATSIFTDNNALTRQQWQSALEAAAANGAAANTIAYYLATAAGENSYPDDNIAGNEMMAYTWYDDYSVTDPTGSVWADLSNALNFTELVPGGEIPERSKRTYGAVTGTMVRILAAPADAPKTGDWRRSVVFYDDKGRAIYSGAADLYQGNIIHTNLSGTQYDFAGRVRMNKHVWSNTNSLDNVASHTELTKYTYDALSGALLNTKHQVDGGTWNVLNTFTYDDMGRVKRKSMGGGAEVQDMSYNIRGQLTGINGRYAETGNKENYNRSFGESIKYDYGFTKKRYDGKMAGMIWRGSNLNRKMAYGYDYTQNQLLLSADFNYTTNTSNTWSKSAMDYSVSKLSYDENGNIMGMKQRGVKPGTGPVDMDIMNYTYESNSNRLAAVTDGGVPDYGAGDFHDNGSTGVDYTYDPNGNLQLDGNKGISGDISYTFFNKPIHIELGNGSSFDYSYDATGGKVQEKITGVPQQDDITTDYIGNAVYENDKLKYILTAEGRTVFDESAALPIREEYFVKDHLGNVRSTLNAVSYSPRNYFADYEIASANLENLIFDHIDELREIKPGEYTAPGTYNESGTMAARLNGNDGKTSVGSALMLHVMAGDKIDMKVQDYYDYYDPNQDNPLSPEDIASNVINALNGGYNGFAGENHNTRLVGQAFNGNNVATYNSMMEVIDHSKPRAYLHYVMFDEHMNIVPEASGFFQAQHEGGWGQIGTTEAMEMPVNGYIAVYLSNATLRDVFFDRLQVELVKSTLLEENHYYPHGLPISGLGSQDAGLANQRRRYQGNEYIRNGGLNWMSFGARQYDPQTGRFLSVDPLAALDDSYSPYTAMGNEPEMMIDPYGLTPGAFDQAQAVTPEAWDNPFARAQRFAMGGGNSAGATFGGGGGGGNFPPGFSSSGLSALALNTFWDILPPMIREQALTDYGSYVSQQQRKQDQNAVGNKFRELMYAIEDGTFNLYITRNAAFDYTINGTEVSGSKFKYTPQYGFAGAIPWALEGAAALVEAVAASGATVAVASYVENIPKRYGKFTSGPMLMVYAAAELATYVYSKGGKQNIWDDQLSPLSDAELAALKAGAIASGDAALKKRVDKEEKRRGTRNKQKRQ